MVVLACIECGQEVESFCLHNGRAVAANEMPIEQAIELSRRFCKVTLGKALDEIRSAREQLEHLQNL